MSTNAQPLLRKRLKTSILMSVTLILVSACGVTESNCDDIGVSGHGGEITITGIVGIRVMRHNDDLTWTEANDTTATPAESLRIHIKMDQIRQQKKRSAAVQQSENSPWQHLAGLLKSTVANTLISTAHACQPTNQATLDAKVVGMSLTSTKQFRDNTAGESLGSEFTVSMIPFDGIEPDNVAYWYRPITINNILSATSTTFRPASSYRFEPSIRESQSSDGTNNELHQFNFTIELDTGEMFTVTSAPVLIAI